MPKSVTINIEKQFEKVKFLNGRTPETNDEDAKDAFSVLSEYRNGGVFIAHYSGYSEWEKHPNGDEFVQVLFGKTTLILLEDNKERRNDLAAGEILIVPKGVWHRFESPEEVKIMTITPQPTEHSNQRPSNS